MSHPVDVTKPIPETLFCRIGRYNISICDRFLWSKLDEKT